MWTWMVRRELADMNLSNPYTLKYLTQMAVWWIEYANLDALRVDTYFYMGYEGAQWTKSIRNEYPNMEFVGEVWGNDPGIFPTGLGIDLNMTDLPAICLKRWISLWSFFGYGAFQ